MSVHFYGEIPSQHISNEVHPSSQGSSQFKAPLRRQSGQLPGQDQRSSTPGSTPSGGLSQFKAPLVRQPGVQSGPLPGQDRPYSAAGAPPFNGAPFFAVTNPSQHVVPQSEKLIDKNGYAAQAEARRLNVVLQQSGPTTSFPRALSLPSIVARETHAAGGPITDRSSALSMYPGAISTDPYVGIPAAPPSLEAQRRTAQFVRGADRALPWAEARAKSEALRSAKTHVTMKVVLIGGAFLFVGGIASFLLLRFPTYLVVTWAILIIVCSNLVSRELRAYYQQKLAARKEAVLPSAVAMSQDEDEEDMGRHPVLKDMSDTTGYLKALCFVFKSDAPAQSLLREKEYQV